MGQDSKSAEERFWDDFTAGAPNRATNLTLQQIDAEIRNALPKELKREVAERLQKTYAPPIVATSQEVVDAAARELQDDPSSTPRVTRETPPEAKRRETLLLIDALNFESRRSGAEALKYYSSRSVSQSYFRSLG